MALERPRFRRRYCVRVVDAESTAVVWETGLTLLHGRLTALLAPHLSGEYTLAELTARLHGTLNALDISYGIAQLARLGYLEEAERLVLPAVRVVALGSDTGLLNELLRSQQVTVAADADVWIAVVDDYLHAGLEALNREALQRNVPWLLLKPTGALPSFGPLFRPFQTACWQCLAARRRETPAHRVLGGPASFAAATDPGAAAAVTAMAASEIVKFLQGNASPDCDLITYAPLTCSLQKHAVVRRQYCAACGEPAPAATPVVFADAAPGGDTFDRLRHHISPVTGIVGSLQQTGEFVVTAVNNFALTSGRSPLRLRGTTSTGKGLSLDQARTGALCEALERYSGCFRGTEALITSSFDALGALAIHPNACMLFSAAQYAGRKAWNLREGDYNWVPQTFDTGRAIEWAPVWSLTRQVFRYLPAAYCYYNYPLPEDHDFCRADSNGNAAGNSLEEAIFHGLLEVIERDAAALWWYRREPRPQVDVASFDLSPHHGAWTTWVLDLTSDFGIPVFAALAQREGASDPPAPLGFGAHTDARVALGRALAELGQGIALMRHERPARVSVGADPAGAYLFPDGSAARPAASYGRETSANGLRACLDRAEELGLETLVLDQTRADVGLHVVKVIVPGMRHFWARFAPGRLYAGAMQEAELNPAHLVI